MRREREREKKKLRELDLRRWRLLNTFIYRWQSIVEDAKRKLESRNDEDGTPIYNHKTIRLLFITTNIFDI